MDGVNASAWEGRTQAGEACISAAQAAQIHATLDDPGRSLPREGDDLPPLWHWCAFTPTDPTGALGRDGHPKLGEFLPPLTLERRMWASGNLRFGAPLKVGEPFTRRSTIAAVTEKEGATGRMVFVTVHHTISGAGGRAIEEEQNIVYLDIPDRFRPPAKRPLPDAPDLAEMRTASESLLFRYSAITFNAHRIHFDLPYARDVEHYPGLVVHGPLQAMWLIDAARRHRGRPPARFRFRGVHPCLLVAGDSAEIAIAGVDDTPATLSLYAGQAGHVTMQATAIWEDDQ